MSPVLRILYGPPGTGKTWRAARDAVKLIDPAVADADISARHQALVDAGRIVWVTFHPSYSYEDFVEGFRPVAADGGVSYVVKPGPFRLACAECSAPSTASAHFHLGQTVTSDTNQSFTVVEVGPQAIRLKKQGGAGGGLGQTSVVSLWLVESAVQAGYQHDSFSNSGEQHATAKQIADQLGVTKASIDGVMAALRAVMYHLQMKGWNPAGGGGPVVLVIDEINRADLSRVFGELMTLIEADKRIGGTEPRQVVLPYSQELFSVPSNLHIIGTMNTADRSLTLMDHALRRRFDFEEVAPSEALCASPYAGVDLAELLGKWNSRITALLSRDHRLGHSYLMKPNLERHRKSRGFADDQDGELRAVAHVLRRNVVPLLLEYFHDDWRKADIVLGRNFGNNSGGLLKKVDFASVNNAAGDVVDLDDVTDFELPDFWNPSSAAWNPDEFRSRLG